MRARWFAAAALVAAAVGITVLRGPAPAVASARVPTATGTPPDPRAVYQSDCAVCHGSDATGTNRGPTLVGVGRASTDYELSTGRMPLASAGRSDSRSDPPVQVLPNIELGNPDQIPQRHAPAYSPATIAALVEYVAGLTGGSGPDIPDVGRGDTAQGGELFRDQCAACHAWAGDGGALLHREAPALHSATPTQIAEAVRVGPGQMPAFGSAALSDDQLASVVRYVRYLDAPKDRGGEPLWHLGPVSEGGLALIALGALLFFVLWIGERG